MFICGFCMHAERNERLYLYAIMAQCHQSNDHVYMFQAKKEGKCITEHRGGSLGIICSCVSVY